MEQTTTESPPPQAAPTVAETAQATVQLAKGWRLRNLARGARAAQLSGDALNGVGFALTVLAAVMLLWGGIVTGGPRVVVLLLTAAILSLRLMVVRLGSMTPADGLESAPPRGGLARWLSAVESAALMMAAGLNPFGAGFDIAPILGLVAAALVLTVSVRLKNAHAVSEPSNPHPTSLLAAILVVSVLEPLWGWRGQILLIGLCVISAVLIVQAVRAPRQASA
jgi:hypothetical protein